VASVSRVSDTTSVGSRQTRRCIHLESNKSSISHCDYYMEGGTCSPSPGLEREYKLKFENGTVLDEDVDKYTLNLTLANLSTGESLLLIL
jgi:hypothetical protein